MKKIKIMHVPYYIEVPEHLSTAEYLLRILRPFKTRRSKRI